MPLAPYPNRNPPIDSADEPRDLAVLATRRHARSQPIPFGPYLAAAGWLALLFGAPILHAYWRWALPH